MTRAGGSWAAADGSAATCICGCMQARPAGMLPAWLQQQASSCRSARAPVHSRLPSRLPARKCLPRRAPAGIARLRPGIARAEHGSQGPWTRMRAACCAPWVWRASTSRMNHKRSKVRPWSAWWVAPHRAGKVTLSIHMHHMLLHVAVCAGACIALQAAQPALTDGGAWHARLRRFRPGPCPTLWP